MYRVGLMGQEPDRLLFLAIPAKIMEEIEDLDLLRNALSAYNVNAVIFDPVNCRIKTWIKKHGTDIS